MEPHSGLKKKQGFCAKPVPDPCIAANPGGKWGQPLCVSLLALKSEQGMDWLWPRTQQHPAGAQTILGCERHAALLTPPYLPASQGTVPATAGARALQILRSQLPADGELTLAQSHGVLVVPEPSGRCFTVFPFQKLVLASASFTFAWQKVFLQTQPRRWQHFAA